MVFGSNFLHYWLILIFSSIILYIIYTSPHRVCRRSSTFFSSIALSLESFVHQTYRYYILREYSHLPTHLCLAWVWDYFFIFLNSAIVLLHYSIPKVLRYSSSSSSCCCLLFSSILRIFIICFIVLISKPLALASSHTPLISFLL